jgi:hypothetical protein
MRTNSGVKPKMKGNAVFTALLFLLCTLSAFSIDSMSFEHPVPVEWVVPEPVEWVVPEPVEWVVPEPVEWVVPEPVEWVHYPITPRPHDLDTLILDGEIIEIKQKAIKTDTDSLEEARKKDVVKIRSPYLISIGAHVGLSAGFYKISSLGDTLTSVNEFLDSKNKVQLNSHFGIDVRLPIYKGLDLGVGYYFNAISLEGKRIDESTLCPEDERVSFENRNGQLWQNYVVFIDPGYETREDQVTLNSYEIKLRTREIPISLRYNFSIPDSPFSIFLGGGIVFRNTSKIEGLPMSTYLLNESGEWRKFNFSDAEIVTQSRVYLFEAGARYSLTPSLTASMDLGFNTKQKELSMTDLYNWDWSSAYLRIGVIKSFDLFKPATLFSR